tara:strand:- start:595 stop:1443 length:849 start_codon:yes stop_codon:yes gene_type:complete
MIFDKQIIQGDKPENKQCIIYYSCDPQYWAEHGQYLARSTLYYNGKQSHIHVHMIYEEGQEHSMKHLIKNPSITYTFERHPKDFYDQFELNKQHPVFARGPEICQTKNDYDLKRKIYLSSARFMLMNKLFDHYQHVLQIDADGICRNTFAIHDFKRITRQPCAMRKPKDRSVYIASCISPGIGSAGSEFKTELANKMIDAFKKPIYWFIDQHVLKDILDTRNFESIPYHWNSWGLKSGGEVFSTAKGKKKYGHRYKNLKYTWFTDKEKLRYHKERNKNYGKS